MKLSQKISLTSLRISLGLYFFYAGVSKVFDPAWSAEGYLKGAKNMTSFYGYFMSGEMLPTTNLLNEWGLLLIGVSLIVGFAVRPAAFFGSMLMLLYYGVILDFPYPDAHSYIIDDHLIFIAIFAVLAAYRAGRTWGIASYLARNYNGRTASRLLTVLD